VPTRLPRAADEPDTWHDRGRCRRYRSSGRRAGNCGAARAAAAGLAHKHPWHATGAGAGHGNSYLGEGAHVFFHMFAPPSCPAQPYNILSLPLSCLQVLEHVEIVAVALGVLINLASTEPDVCSLLSTAASGAGRCAGGVLPLLCSILTATAEGVAACPAAAKAATDSSGGDGNPAMSTSPERTRQRTPHKGHSSCKAQAVGALPAPASAAPSPSWLSGASDGGVFGSPEQAGGEDEDVRAGEAAIAEAYCAMLAGFLLRGDKKLQRLAASLLPGGTLQPVVSAVRRCLSFYVTAGAITGSTRDKLVQLLAELEAVGAGGSGSGAHGGGSSGGGANGSGK
jgi:hypothetical protein